MQSINLGNVAEQWFNRYLTERQYSWEEEPDLGAGTFADRLVAANNNLVVKSFAGEGIFKGMKFQGPRRPASGSVSRVRGVCRRF